MSDFYSFALPNQKSMSSIPMSRKADYAWKYNVGEVSEDVIHAANALENIQLDRKARNLTTWRVASFGCTSSVLISSGFVLVMYWHNKVSQFHRDVTIC
ncbi:hypothetical protein ZIOFF_023866 [Zingiber officinale]|uniref:Uncharacterized protein n=1 Tax=Zingiber officinale TaxID=94328 RepID=A0A8J5H770_ZINOF|nr:hypothetical protein ZIOFF_023866 [Zingiber officinale]